MSKKDWKRNPPSGFKLAAHKKSRHIVHVPDAGDIYDVSKLKMYGTYAVISPLDPSSMIRDYTLFDRMSDALKFLGEIMEDTEDAKTFS